MYAILYILLGREHMARSTDITSFTEHRKRLREHILMVRETGRPLYVTTNGKTDAVVLSPEAYDALADRAEFAESLALIDRSLEDIREGRTHRAKPALKKLADELGCEALPVALSRYAEEMAGTPADLNEHLMDASLEHLDREKCTGSS